MRPAGRAMHRVARAPQCEAGADAFPFVRSCRGACRDRWSCRSLTLLPWAICGSPEIMLAPTYRRCHLGRQDDQHPGAPARETAKGRMKRIPKRTRSKPDELRYTHLSASVSEEDGGFTVQVKLYDEADPAKG